MQAVLRYTLSFLSFSILERIVNTNMLLIHSTHWIVKSYQFMYTKRTAH